MFEAYAIGVTLKLNNLISPQLLLIGQELIKLEGLFLTLKSAANGTGMESAALKSIAAAANSSNVAMEKATRSTAAFERQLLSVKAASAGLGAMPMMLPGGGGGRAPGGGGGGGGTRTAGLLCGRIGVEVFMS